MYWAGESTRPTLLSRVRDGSDDVAWREFDAKYRQLILSYALRRGVQTVDAEDVRQEVMLSLSTALPHFRYLPEVGRFRDYLATTVRHAIYACLARRRRADALEPPDAPEPALEPDATDELWEQEWRRHHLRQALASARKDFDERTVAIFEGLLAGSDARELAARHSVSLDVVYQAKARVRARVQERIARQVEAEEPRHRTR